MVEYRKNVRLELHKTINVENQNEYDLKRHHHSCYSIAGVSTSKRMNTSRETGVKYVIIAEPIFVKMTVFGFVHTYTFWNKLPHLNIFAP